MQGTVPYLGIFLTDLTMLDAALPDHLPGGLLNFDKRRREFRILAQIKLLQSAANCYNLEPDPAFVAWFDSLPLLSDDESYQLSCLVEPPSNSKRSPLRTTRAATELDLDTSSLASSGGNSYDRNCRRESLPRNGRMQHRAWQSTGSLLSALSLQRSPGMGMMSQCPPPAPSHAPDLKVIRVSLEQPQEASSSGQGLTLYKSILLSNGDHTNTVVRNALDKHGVEGDPDEFELAQQLPDSEIVFPASANVFYALSTAHALNFVLRPKKSEPPSPVGPKKFRKPFQLKKLLQPTGL